MTISKPPCQLTLAQLCLAALAIGAAFLAVSPGGWPLVLATLTTGLLVFGVGYSILRVAAFQSQPSSKLPIAAFPSGLIACCGLAQMFYHQGLPQAGFWAATVAVAIAGMFLAWRDLRGKWEARVTYSWWYLAIVLFAGFTQYLPKSLRDSVPADSGGMTWMHVDSAFHEAIAGLLAAEPPPARIPGLGLLPHYYHYGHHALAALESTAFGLSISDAVTRSNHFLGVTAIVLASIALGRAAARQARYQALAGLLAPWLVCLPNMFASVLSYNDPAARHPFASYLPGLIGGEIKIRCYEGFLALGWSDLWGSIVSITVASLLSAGAKGVRSDFTERPRGGHPARRGVAEISSDTFSIPALLVAVLGIPVNGVAALVCVLVVVASGVILRPGWKSVAFGVFGIALLWLFRRAVDLHHASIPMNVLDAGGVLFGVARTASVAFTVLFGLRGLCVMNLAWGSRETKLTMCLFVFAFLGLGFVFELQSCYDVLFLMLLLSAFAAAPLAVLLQSWRSGPAAFAVAMGAVGRTFRSYFLGLLTVLGAFLPICWFPFLRHRTLDSIYGVSALLAIAVPICALAYGLIARAMRRGWTVGRAPAAAAFLVVLGLSISGFVRHQLGWNCDCFGNSVQVDAGRMQSLTFVRDHVPPGALVATTHHFVDVGSVPERSYVYAALAHRNFFVEGWAYGYTSPVADVGVMRHDNDVIFQTRDADVAERLVRKWGVTHLLVEPDAPLGFDATKAAWLRPLANPGSLIIYEVVPGAAAHGQ